MFATKTSNAEHEDAIRIITARHATRAERKVYEEGGKLAADELRPEYKRSDFGALVHGKYIERLQTSLNVVVIDPEFAHLFPNTAAVNKARSLAQIAKRAGSRQSRTH